LSTKKSVGESAWLLIPPIALCIVDNGLTLYGQSDEYWNGDYASVNELSPSFARYLAIHPLAFVAAGLLWMAIFSTLIGLLPRFWAVFITIGIVLGHMTGAASWLAYRFGSYQSANLLFAITALIVTCALRRVDLCAEHAIIDWSRFPLPNWTRWVAIAILFALPAWWFFIPR
jgi:hypothetical protein